MDFEEFAGKIISGLQSQHAEMIRNFQSFLRRKSDEEIRRYLNAITPSDSRYPYVAQEARRRGLQ